MTDLQLFGVDGGKQLHERGKALTGGLGMETGEPGHRWRAEKGRRPVGVQVECEILLLLEFLAHAWRERAQEGGQVQGADGLLDQARQNKAGELARRKVGERRNDMGSRMDGPNRPKTLPAEGRERL